jgi:uracil-DNA glycosylase
MPPSLVNIFKEIRDDLKKPIPPRVTLNVGHTKVFLLLNATLTVRGAGAGITSKQRMGGFYRRSDKKKSQTKKNTSFSYSGVPMPEKGEVIDRSKHLVLMSAHPSPFSADRGFFGSKHFSKANEYLKSKGLGEIDW